MKYIVLVADGMADYPIAELDGRTPLEAARTPHLDFIAAQGRIGRVKTIPEHMTPASDVANIAILGYDPKQFYSGRGPLEAANLGVNLDAKDVAFRCNLITASADTVVDYSAGHISSKESAGLIEMINQRLGNDRLKFFPGVSYRNLLVVKNGTDEGLEKLACTAPHDILGKSISGNMPQGKNSQLVTSLMEESRKILSAHEINLVRLDLKENPANMIWLWGQGKKPDIPSFKQRFGLTGAVISAVDLIKGLGKILGLDVIDVPGATGYYDTDYEGKARAALRSLKKDDFVFLHVEAPDEAGHNGDLREKITAIERFDQLVVGTILTELKGKDDFRLMVLPDHPTPVALRTHTNEEVPFVIYGKGITGQGAAAYSEKEALQSAFTIPHGHDLMGYLIQLRQPE